MRPESPAPEAPRDWRQAVVIGALLVAVAGGGLTAARTYSRPAALFGSPRPLVVDVQPKGIEVVVDGQSRLRGRKPDDILRDVLERTPVPVDTV